MIPEYIDKRLKEIAELPAGWYDGEGVTPSSIEIETARRICNLLIEAGVFAEEHHGMFGICAIPVGGIRIERIEPLWFYMIDIYGKDVSTVCGEYDFGAREPVESVGGVEAGVACIVDFVRAQS